jgi:hypothetical protein
VLVNALSEDVGASRLSSVTAVLVLGMHRSGTSSVAGALVRLGGDAPLHMVPPQPDNERGYWESSVIVDLNSEVLAAGDSDWLDWRKFDCSRIRELFADGLRAHAKATLLAEFANAEIPVIKDPRMCRLLRFWAPVFVAAGWSARAVLPLRSPLEVAWSLERRDGIDPSLGCLLWLRHILDAEAETRCMARAILDWSGFLGDPRAVLGRVIDLIGLNWPRWSEDGLAAVEGFLSDDLRHCRADVDQLRVHPAISDLGRAVYDEMLRLADDPLNTQPLSRLDALRADFETAVAVFDPAMRHFERGLAQARRQLERASPLLDQAADRPPALSWSRKVLRRLCGSTKPKAGLETIRSSALFDAVYYLNTNPGVRETGCDPALHYLEKGAQEGRDPGPAFCTRAYLRRNPDVADAGVNPLLHYETRGRKKGRSCGLSRLVPGNEDLKEREDPLADTKNSGSGCVRRIVSIRASSSAMRSTCQ